MVSRLETRISELLQEASKSSISVHHSTDETLTREIADPESDAQVVAMEILANLCEEKDVRGIAQLLDIYMDSEPSIFFNIVESALGMLPLEQCHELWPYFEVRHEDLSRLSQGANSVVFLRTCRSLLSRLDPELDRLDSGRVILLLSVVKGFAHPSRLNKREKIRVTDPEGFVRNLESENRLSLTRVSNVLQDLSKLPAPELKKVFNTFLRKLHRKHASANETAPAGLEDLTGFVWSNHLDASTVKMLTEQLLLGLSAVASSGVIAENPDLRILLSKVTHAAERMLEREYKSKISRVLVSEQQWKAWKADMCPYIEGPESDTEPLPESIEKPMLGEVSQASEDKLPDLLAKIGNERLTRLLKSQPGSQHFYEQPVNNGTFAKLAEGATSNRGKEYSTFMIRRTTGLEELFNKQEAEPVNTHEELKKEEELLSNQPASIKRAPPPSSLPTEPSHKRPRISYEEDTRYQDRQRVAQNTLRPLPY